MPAERLERIEPKSEPRSQNRDLGHPTLVVGSDVGRPRNTRSLTACFCTISVPHPFAFFLAKGWESANPDIRNHTVKDLVRARRRKSSSGFPSPIDKVLRTVYRSKWGITVR
jgi:hypothetical protein